MGDTLHWGIMGCGKIARKLAEAVNLVEGAELTAVGSRTQDKADAFGDEFGAAEGIGHNPPEFEDCA